jgi:hypothetical protein
MMGEGEDTHDPGLSTPRDRERQVTPEAWPAMIPVRAQLVDSHGPTPETRSMRIRITNPGGGFGIAGKTTSGPM